MAPDGDVTAQWIEQARLLPEPTAGEAAVVREIWKARLDASMKRRWAWAASALAVAVGEDVARAGRGIGAFGWDGDGDLHAALRKVVTAEPGLALLVLFEGADASRALDAAREVMRQPGSALRELAVVARGDGICRIVRVLRLDEVGGGVLAGLAPGAGAETVERTPPGPTAAEPADPPEPATARLLFVPPESGDPRDVGVLGARAHGLRPGTWVVLSRQDARVRGWGRPASESAEIFALGRISRQPGPGSRLLTYDLLSLPGRPVPVRLPATGGGHPSPVVSLASAAAAFGTSLENVDRAAPSMAAGDVLAPLPHLPVGFAASVAATVNAGKNLLLVGAPGAGKTTAAVGLARAFHDAGFVDGHPRVVGGDGPDSWRGSMAMEARRNDRRGEGGRSRGTPQTGASRLLIVDDLEADALPVLVRELAGSARPSDPSAERLSVVATALPRAVLDERAMPWYPSRHLVVMRLPPAGLDALSALVERSRVLAEPAKAALVALVGEAAAWVTWGVVADVVRYLEELQGVSGRAPAPGTVQEAFELFAAPFAGEGA
ncbi:ATP-binding protein [Streptomyces sp. NPDC021608]|uniref:ATP-binding protein n=1 Tax=Streptomyces sp. NPDC021608 TaxID=3154903 RepID=UPI0033C0FED4